MLPHVSLPAVATREPPPPAPPRRVRQVVGAVGLALAMAAGLAMVHLPWLGRDLWRPEAGGLAPAHHLALGLYVFAAALGAMAALTRSANRREAALRAQSITDPLTGLCNRRYFTGRLHSELSRSRRAQTPLALLLVDIDHLKALNDAGGHSAGDHVIREVAQSIVQACRSTDVCARLGGDEFAVLAPATTARQAVELAHRLQAATRRLPESGRQVTTSIGVSDLASAEAPSAEALLGAADGAMYRAKRAGRDQVVVSDPKRPSPLWAPLPPAAPLAPTAPPWSPHGPH